MTYLILALCIPLTAVVTGYFTLKAVHLGLRWQMETKAQQLPTMDKPLLNPFEQKPKEVALDDNILQEWLNGPPKKKEGE